MVVSPQTRASLLLRLCNREDDEAWSEFVEIYQPVLYRMARSRGLQDADAREIVQNVLLSVAKQVHEYSPKKSNGSFRAWLATMVRTQAVNLISRQIKKQQVGGSGLQEQLYQLADHRQSLEDTLEQEHRRQLFLWAAKSLKCKLANETWQAFWLTCVMDQPINQVAQQLKMSVGAIYVARSRVIAKLRQMIIEHQSLCDGDSK